MIVNSTRFGMIQSPPENLIHFAEGLIGMPAERDFVFVGFRDSEHIAWLQSVASPAVALPVVSAHAFSPRYPDFPLEEYAKANGMHGDSSSFAVVVVLTPHPGGVGMVNLVAPIVIDSERRIGAQFMAHETKFSTRELLFLPESDENPSPELSADDAPRQVPSPRLVARAGEFVD